MGAPRTKRHGLPSELGRLLEGLSRKSIRILWQDGVLDALREGGELAVTGPVGRLGISGPFARLAFCIDGQHRLSVGYAVGEGAKGPWRRAGGEFEPFSLRSYGYFRRYIRRLPPAS